MGLFCQFFVHGFLHIFQKNSHTIKKRMVDHENEIFDEIYDSDITFAFAGSLGPGTAARKSGGCGTGPAVRG